MERIVSTRRFWSACLGNLFEHYDNALFGFLSPFLAPLIFPKYDPLTALILTFAMIPLGMIARPIGSLFFGYIGDRKGRQKALFLSLSGMAVVSLGVALSPTYLQAGILSPILFCLGRVLQNFFASGETIGGAIFLLEGSPKARHDFLSSLYNASTIGGILLASGGVALLSFLGHTASSWRVLYLIGTFTALFGALIRRQETAPLPPITARPSLFKTFIAYRKPLFLIMIISGFAYANYTMALVLMNGLIPLLTSYSKAQMMGLNTLLLILDFALLPLFGYLASRYSRYTVMIGAALLTAMVAAPLLALLKTASLPLLILIRSTFVLLGVAFFAPFHAWAKELVPAHCRYGIIALGYALGSQLLGGPTSALSLWLLKTTGTASGVAIYWIVLALAATCALVTSRQTKPVDDYAI